jgi:type IV pilus assembly protein PilC
MASFAYVARDSCSGAHIVSSVEAASEQDAVVALHKRNLLVVSINEKLARKGRTAGGKVALADQVIFTRQLATMISAGLAMVQSLRGLAKQTRSKVMRDVIEDVCKRVEGGDSFSEALQKHPKAFSQLYVSMVGAGEKGGLLAEILARLATYLETMARLRKKVKSAMMYPTIIVLVAILVVIFLLVKVVPVFGEVYAGFGAKLPAPTLFLVQFSTILKKYIILTVPAAVVAVYGWMYMIKTKQGREFWDSCRIRLPIFGDIAHKICLARFTRTLASLIRSGVPILEVMRISSQIVGNVVMQKAVNVAADDIERGENISDALSKHPVFPDMIIRMISAGEQTGKIDDMLERVSDFLDEEIETTLSGLTSLIEPILIVFLGVVVGGMVICMFLPIFKLSEIVGKK